LEEICNKEMKTWVPFAKKELLNTIESYNNTLTPSLDKLSWRHLKEIIRNEEYIDKLINIANIYINLEHWPSHFKALSTVIISKPIKNFLWEKDL